MPLASSLNNNDSNNKNNAMGLEFNRVGIFASCVRSEDPRIVSHELNPPQTARDTHNIVDKDNDNAEL